MKAIVLLGAFFLSMSVHSKGLMSCESVDFKTILDSTVPLKSNLHFSLISLEDRKEEIVLLKKCLRDYALCMVEAKRDSKHWFSRVLAKPRNTSFNPEKQTLMFTVMQFIDKKTKQPICIVARNSFDRISPWVAKAWVIDGDINKEYLISDPAFYHTITPEILYESLLRAYEQAKIDALEEDRWFEKNRLLKMAASIASNQIKSLQELWF